LLCGEPTKQQTFSGPCQWLEQSVAVHPEG